LRYSILIPVYNSAAYLPACVDSVLAQEISDFEVILVDDGSTDGKSGGICDAYAQKDSRVRVIHQNNQGALMARYNAMQAAIGDYFCFLDSDDWWEQDALSVIDKAITTHEPDMLIFRYRCKTKFRTLYSAAPFPHETVLSAADKKDLLQAIAGEQINAYPIKAVKREIAASVDLSHYSHLTVSEDLLQTVLWFDRADSVLFLHDVLYNYRDNENGITRAPFSKKHFTSLVTVEHFVYRYLQSAPHATEKALQSHVQVALSKISRDIGRIACARIPFKEKEELFSFVLTLPYFKEELFEKKLYAAFGYNTKKRFDHLLNRRYKQLILWEKTVDFPQKCKSALKAFLLRFC